MRDLTATRVLVWIVVNFIFSHSLKVILNIVEIYAAFTMNKKGSHACPEQHPTETKVFR